MPVLTVRITEEEKALLAKRAKQRGVKTATLVREFIHEVPVITAADLLAQLEPLMGNKKLRIKRRP